MPGNPQVQHLDSAMREFAQAVRRFDAAAAQRQQAEQVQRLEQQRLIVESLERSVNESQRRIVDLNRFNQIVGHDLRGPLIGIVGVVELARRALRLGQREQAEAMLDAIGRQAESSMQFLEDLLDSSRDASGEPKRESLALGTLVAESVERVMLAQAAAQRVQWQVHELPEAGVDANLMRQVLDNLIGNAVKFSVDRDRPMVTIGCKTSGIDLVLFVQDNGSGFDAERENLFAPYSRGRDTAADGYGLGLSIARHAVEALGGRLWCDSAPGLGASFSFTLGPPELVNVTAPAWPPAAQRA